MKKFLLVIFTFLFLCNICLAEENNLSIWDLKRAGVRANAELSQSDLDQARKILLGLHKQTLVQIEKGYGPFLAVIYDEKGNIVAQMPNTVVKDQNCLNHAEMNTIREAQKKLKTYNLAPYNLTIYSSAEPCIMCVGGIMWSGIGRVFYSVDSKDVERITGFDEGYKKNWLMAFKKRNIKVYGNIETEAGKKVLSEYVKLKKEVYKPSGR